METLTIAHYLFSEEEKHHLQTARDHQDDGRLKLRFVALLMLAEEIAIDAVARVMGKSIPTLERWGEQYLKQGLNSLNSFNYKAKQSALTPWQIEQVVAWVKQTHPASAKQVKAYIADQFKVNYTVETVRVLMQKQGLRRLRPPTQPGHPPSVEEQQAVVTTYGQMKAECAPGTPLLFLDGMHLVHQLQPGYCWGDPKAPPVFPTNTGRKRLNILGAYHPADYSLLHVTGEASCNGERVVELFEVIAARYAQAPEIIMFSDNATYLYSKTVYDWLEAHPRMWLLPLPPYAPNLNLIERLWRFVKEHGVKNTYYAQYTTFRAQVFRLLNQLDASLEALKTLLVERFQIIEPKVVSC
jgi:transposase